MIIIDAGYLHVNGTGSLILRNLKYVYMPPTSLFAHRTQGVHLPSSPHSPSIYHGSWHPYQLFIAKMSEWRLTLKWRHWKWLWGESLNNKLSSWALKGDPGQETGSTLELDLEVPSLHTSISFSFANVLVAHINIWSLSIPVVSSQTKSHSAFIHYHFILIEGGHPSCQH